jgi:hypothetical protein
MTTDACAPRTSPGTATAASSYGKEAFVEVEDLVAEDPSQPLDQEACILGGKRAVEAA